MEQTGNEIISGVRCLWREWQGICSNIWEVIRCESPTCVLQQPCFSHTHIKLHKLQHGEKWRWERLHAWAAEAVCRGIWSGIQKECCAMLYFFLSSLHPSPQQVWIGWDITTTTEKTIICEYLSQLSVGVLQCFLHLFTGWCPSSTTPQLPLYLSTSHCPLATLHYLQPPHSSLKSLSRTPALPPWILWALCCRWLNSC